MGLQRLMDNAMNDIQGMQMSGKITGAYNQSQMMANQGMGAASLGLYNRALNRGINTSLNRLGYGRGLLQGVGSVVQGAGESGLDLAAQNESIRRQNQLQAIQTGLQVGGMENEMDRYKKEAAWNALNAKMERRNKMWSSIIGAVGGIAGSAAGSGGALTKLI